ncbi:shikimate dehydrogenase [Candidatus Riesia pediculischaeffi]|uniref:Shikimate dehydrogenase (NADP(+)) n=1 Tax=Candidatus Riesia pediculischaeffi PTSU TaxID=1401651 RepID=A0A0C1S0M4_9ENTR|nr:shikimate dehydrogenase [Candidatus Riesia pediculischaeffi]KIE64117.1 Shikimate 5-dehydrogenase I alpha [Candidatus Riesia pediculischaeffi PTSU]
MNKFAIFGNPISHSRSPEIYRLFAKQFGIRIEYQKELVSASQLKKKIYYFFYSKNGKGLNITTPFKKHAYRIVHKLTNRAKDCKSINVIKREEKILFGDNTDGIGITMDIETFLLQRKKTNILMIGAGDAARSAIVSLLRYPVEITLVNRTYDRSKKITCYFQHTGKISCKKLEQINSSRYDLIINATSSGIFGKTPKISSKIFENPVFCYDMFYRSSEDTPFIQLVRRHGISQYSDGMGMLIWQAAFSFKFWTGKMPNVQPLLKIFKK